LGVGLTARDREQSVQVTIFGRVSIMTTSYVIAQTDFPGRPSNELPATKRGASSLAPRSANVCRLSRKLATEAADNALLAPEIAAGITRVKGPRRQGRPPSDTPASPPTGRYLHAKPKNSSGRFLAL